MKINFDKIVIHQEREWILNLLTNLLQCKICMNLLNDPYDCIHCNQTFCKKCIKNYINTNKKCPYDIYFKNSPKQPNIQKEKVQFNIKPSSANITKIINSLKIYCKYRKNGCNSELSIEQVKDHENNCLFKNQKLIKTKILEEEKEKNNNLNKDKDENFVSELLLKKIEDKCINKELSKYKTQDSCVSFRKLDDFDNNSLILSPKDNCSNSPKRTHSSNNTLIFKLNEKIDSIYNIIKSERNYNSYNINNNNNNNNNITNTESNQFESFEYDPQSTPKLGCKNNKKNYISNQNSNSKSSSNNVHIQKLLYDMQNLINKVQDIERLIQSNNSFQKQNYSIQSEENNISSPTSSYASTHYNTTSNSAYSSCIDIKKKLNEKINKPFKNNLAKQPIKNSIYNYSGRNNNMNKILYKKNTTKENSDKLNSSSHIINNSLDNYEEVKEIFEKVIDEKIEGIKKYIDEKCLEELKKFYMDITLDNTNLFAQKFDELHDVICPNKK